MEMIGVPTRHVTFAAGFLRVMFLSADIYGMRPERGTSCY
jgi:hypothetical protein